MNRTTQLLVAVLLLCTTPVASAAEASAERPPRTAGSSPWSAGSSPWSAGSSPWSAGSSPAPASPGYLPAGPGDDAPPAAARRYRLPVPAPARILTGFRPPAQRWGAGHRGVDLAGAPGLAIRAAGAGTVAFAGMLAGRPVISIRHTASLRTTYEPVHPLVHAGQQVSAGAVIGTLEAGHASCRPADCLHWGARVGADHYVDPMALLSGLQVRLKPWDG